MDNNLILFSLNSLLDEINVIIKQLVSDFIFLFLNCFDIAKAS